MYDKPGCFGSAITFSVKSGTCKACDFRETCEVQARERLEELKPMVSTDAIEKLSFKAPARKGKRTLPEHIQRLLDSMTTELREASGVLIALIAKDQGLATSLASALVKKGHEVDDAKRLTRKVLTTLSDGKAIELQDGRIILRNEP